MVLDNKLLKNILTNVGGSVNGLKPNNQLLRQIAENTGSEDIEKNKSNNYYLKQIATNTENTSSSLNEANATIAQQAQLILELEGDVDSLENSLNYALNNSVALLAESDIIQTGETCILKAIVKTNGEKSVNTDVYFYVEE